MYAIASAFILIWCPRLRIPVPSAPHTGALGFAYRCPRLRIPVPSAPLGHLRRWVIMSVSVTSKNLCFPIVHLCFTAGTRAEPRVPGFPKHIEVSWQVPERSRGYRGDSAEPRVPANSPAVSNPNLYHSPNNLLKYQYSGFR